MSLDSLKNSIQEKFKILLPSIGEVLEQQIQRKPEVNLEVTTHQEVKQAVQSLDLPRIGLIFHSVVNTSQYFNLVLVPPDLVRNYYAWMVQEEPAENLGEEHLDALKEAAQQFAGHIKMVEEVNKNAFEIKNLTAFVANTWEDLEEHLADKSGVQCQYTLKIEENNYSLDHFIWGLNDETNMAEELAMEAKETVQEAGEVEVHPAEFGNLSQAGAAEAVPRNVDMLLDVELEITVELGRKNMYVSDILKLGKGSIIELEKAAGEPLDIFVNGKKMAEGEVVVVDDHFAIRITQLVDPKDRIKGLG